VAERGDLGRREASVTTARAATGGHAPRPSQ